MMIARSILFLLVSTLLFFAGCEELTKLDEQETTNHGNGAEPSKMIFIPAGEFTMGSDFSPKPDFQDGITDEGFSDEHPEHTVYLSDYLMDVTEVTNAQYRECVLDGACTEPRTSESLTREDYYTNPAFDNYPVLSVTWYQAQTYCQWAGKRLPTEAEWEKTARGAADERNYPWGDDEPTCGLSNYGEVIEIDGSTQVGCIGDTQPVASYPFGMSPYGVFDMAGNVSEWVSDWYNADYYNSDIFPDNLINPQGPPDGSLKVVRSGSFIDRSFFIRAAMRSKQNPYLGMPHIGFRCAKNAG